MEEKQTSIHKKQRKQVLLLAADTDAEMPSKKDLCKAPAQAGAQGIEDEVVHIR